MLMDTGINNRSTHTSRIVYYASTKLEHIKSEST